MSKFTDAAGHEWTLDINLDSVETVKEKCSGLSLYELLNDKCEPLADLLSNRSLLAQVCWILAGGDGNLDAQRAFCRALKGDALQAMEDAFLEELGSFSPPAQRAALEQFLRTAKAVHRKGLEELTKQLKKIEDDPATALTQMLSSQSGSLPDTSDSTSPAARHAGA